MSDLISRSELYMNDLIRRKDVLALFPTNDCSDKMVGLYERVLDIPTAYDKEKVVAELEEKAQDYRDRRIHHQTIGNMDNAVAFGHKEDAVRKSILIVRKGGVE